MTDRTTQLNFKAKATGAAEVKKLGRTIGELSKIDAFGKLAKQSKESLTAWKAAQAEVKRLANEYKSAEKPTAALRKEFERAKKHAANLKNEYTGNRKKLADLRQELSAAGISTGKLNAEQKRLQASLAKTRREAGRALKLDAARGLLDVQPYKNVQREIKRLELAYRRLEKSGTLSAKELAQAKTRLKQKIGELRGETDRLPLSFSNARASMLALAGGVYAAARALAGVGGVLRDAETATFNLEASVGAANREFQNVGTVKSWSETVRNLGGELKIYSDSALKNAISRTIDMTKRLGLSEQQMQKVIVTAANLGAGKVSLEGSVERLTAALRGEAESAEYLGLTLNENYIKAIYEASGATQGAWKDLTDLQKAQIRYTELLKQSAEMQGRAQKSAETLAGSWAMVRKEIDNAITNNPEAAAGMRELAKVLRDNSAAIGGLVGDVVSFVAKTIDWTVKNKTLVAGLGAALVAIKALKFSIGDMVVGLGAMIRNVGTAQVAVTGLAGSVGTLDAAGKAFILANPVTAITATVGAAAAFITGRLIGYKFAMDEANAATQRLLENAGKVRLQFADFANIEIKTNLAGQPLDDLVAYSNELMKAKAYTQALVAELTVRADQTTFFGRQTKDAKLAQVELEKVRERMDEINVAQEAAAAAIKKAKEATAEQATEEERLAGALEKTTEALKKTKDVWKKAYTERSQIYNADTRLRKAELDKQVAEIELAEKKGLISAQEAAVKKQTAEKEFTQFKIEQLTQQLEFARRVYGAESAEYKNVLAAKISATTTLTKQENALTEAEKALAAAKRALISLSNDQADALNRAAKAAGNEAAAIDKGTEAINRRNKTPLTSGDGKENTGDRSIRLGPAKPLHDRTLAQLKNLGFIDPRDPYAGLKRKADMRAGAPGIINDAIKEYESLIRQADRYGVKIDTQNTTLAEARKLVADLKEEYAKLLKEAEKLAEAERAAFMQRRLEELRKKHNAPKMAAGGPIYGPSHRRGGVLIEAEGGEYMHPGAAVRAYGRDFMAAIRSRLIDPAAVRALMAKKFNFNIPKFETGGPVVAGATAGAAPTVSDVVELRLFMGNDRAVLRGDRANTEGFIQMLKQFKGASRG